MRSTLGGIAGPGPDAAAAARDSAFVDALRAQLQAATAAGRFSGAVLLARDGLTVFEGAYGLADRDRSWLHSAHQPYGSSMRERASFCLRGLASRVRRGSGRSITTTTIQIACLTVLLSCSGEPTTPPPVVSPPVTQPPAQPEIPITGAAVAGMGSYDQIIPDLMRKYNIPGGAVAVLRDGKLIYARGFGYADVENRTPVQPDALFRIASVSKPITSAAIMKLVEEGKFKVDDRVAPFIAHLAPAPGATVDSRWEQITIRHLLNHTGGWDHYKPNGGFDPMLGMGLPAIAAAAVGAPAPASAETLIRYMKGMPLDFNPGEKHAYSNFGYAILGRVIERVSGMPYEEYVRARVLLPVGANRTRTGKTRMSDALADEVKYYVPGGTAGPLVPSVFPGEGPAPSLNGGLHIESLDSGAGWVSSTVDLLRFLTGVDGRANRPDILGAGTVAEMTGSGPTLCAGGACYYAFGWVVRPTQGDATWSHTGSLPGTTSILVRSYHNFSWVALFNARNLPGFDVELEAALRAALAQSTSFPTHDLFSTFR